MRCRGVYNSTNPPGSGIIDTSQQKNNYFQNLPTCKGGLSDANLESELTSMSGNQATLPWQVGSAMLIPGVLW